ncbi:MAG: pimeloyl-[acyl-carrier protein] methyl ester esterase [Gaiellaceae bacterium]|nr:pimeloyl-[acyl-carrier protein] methyl ester esterase [Gaiellaceae bacterium]
MTDATILLPGLEERLYERRGARIRTFEGGEGPPLLLVHGFGGAAWNFTELAPLLPGRRLIIPDLPGHGGSSPLPAPTLTGFADLLAELLDEPVDVLGHSMGGVVALRLAERHPSLVRRLVLAAAAGISSSTRLAELTIALTGMIQPGRIAGRRVGLVARSRRLRRLVFEGFEVANADLLTERAVHGFLRGPTMHTDALGAGLALAGDDPRQDLDRVGCPVLILWGARDRQVPLGDGFEYARRLGAPLRVIADCGHLLIGERPDVCARAVLEFTQAS